MATKLPRPDLSKLSESDKDKVIMALFDHIDALLARVETLEAQLRKNSSNSNKPPSSDGLVKKTRSLREPSGKLPGAQVGRKGTTLRQTVPTEVISHPLPEPRAQCCAALLPLELAQVWCRRQVIDILVAAYEVVEHVALAVTCRCGQLHTSAFPADVNEAVQYSPKVRALGVHLTQGQMLPYARAAA